MAIDNIDKLDNLNEGRIKLNAAIDQANLSEIDSATAIATADGAVVIANTADSKSTTTQQQLDTIIVASGTSDAETIQARGGEPLLYNRLDKSDTQLAQTAKQQQTTPTMQPYDSRIELFRDVMVHDADNNIYAVYSRIGATHLIEKSSDNGVTWVAKGLIPVPIRTLTKISKTGTLIAVAQALTTVISNPKVYRSTDDGATWVEVSAGLKLPPLGNQGVTETPSGAILIGEYGNIANTVHRVMRSTDDGITWASVLESPGTDPAGDPGHFHSVTYDPYENKLITFMDRPDNLSFGARIHVSSDNGATWQLLGVVDTIYKPNFVSPMYFETHIAWGSDNQRNGVVSRIKRTDFYAGNFTETEDVAFLNKKVFYYTFPLRPGVWAVSMANETVASGTVPEGPGNFANEVFIVSDNGSVVSGGITQYQSNIVPGVLSGNKIYFPSYKFDRLDHKGLSWLNLVTGTPRTYGAIPYSQGVSLPSTNVGNWLTQTPSLPNMLPLHGKGTNGVDIAMISVDNLNRVIVRNGLNGNHATIRLLPDGDLDILRNNVRRLYTLENGQIVIPQLAVASNGLGFFATGGDPNGVITAIPGSLCLNWNFSKGVGLWVKETGTGNTGWIPLCSIGGSTAARPTIKYIGSSYFDTILGKPIWWDGGKWVDANGVTV